MGTCPVFRRERTYGRAFRAHDPLSDSAVSCPAMPRTETPGPGSGLPDHLAPGLDVVLVGINPGLRSAARGHHFSGPGNRFWKLLADSGLTPSLWSYERDAELPELGIGLTNIVARPSASSSELGAADYARGRSELSRKLARLRPRAVAFVGVTVFREFWPELGEGRPPRRVECGLRTETIAGASLFVLPNPSGRNAHYSYEDMLSCWQSLAVWLREAG